MDGMVHTRELSIHVVKGNKPKMLTGLSQKGTVARYRDYPLPCHGLAMLPVTDCNRNWPGLQSARFRDHMNGLYRHGQDHIRLLATFGDVGSIHRTHPAAACPKAALRAR